MRAHAPEPGLYFVGNADAARASHRVIRRAQVTGWRNDLAANARTALRDECAEPLATALDGGDSLCDVTGVLCARLAIAAFVRAAIHIRQWNDVHPRWGTRAASPSMLVRADFNESGAVPVIGSVEYDRFHAAGVRACEPECKLIRFASGVDEPAHAERRIQRRAQPLGVLVHQVVQVPGVGVEHRHLLKRGAHDLRMRVSHVRHVVDGVEVTAAVIVEEILHPSALDLERLVVREADVAAEVGASRRERCGPASGRGGVRVGPESEQRARVGREALPHRALACWRDTREIGAEAKSVDKQLEMQVRSPSAVHRRGAKRGNALSASDVLSGFQTAQRLHREMTVEREKRRAVARAVRQHDDWTVVERRSVVCKGVHRAVERCMHRRSGRRKEVDAQVHRSPFGVRRRACRKRRSVVHEPCLPVSADADLRTRLAHGRGDARGEHWLGVLCGVAVDERTADAEIEHK